MKILLVNPPEYGFLSWIYRSWNPSVYKLGSWYRQNTNYDFEIYNLRPELQESRCAGGCRFVNSCDIDKAEARKKLGFPPSKLKNIEMLTSEQGIYSYKGEIITKQVGNRSCGNWENEHISRALFRIGRPIDGYVKKLLDYKPDEVQISGLFTYWWEGVKEVVDITKKVSPKTKISIGGIYPKLAPEHTDLLKVDHVNIKSKAFKQDFTWMDLTLFEDVPCMIDVITSLGCPNSCGYCAVHMIEGHKRLFRDPMDVVNELEYYANNGVKYVRFLDSNLLCTYEKHFKIILDEIIKRNIDLCFISYGGVEARFVTEENLNLMKQAGFEGMNIPIETVSPDLLKRWNRTLESPMWNNLSKIIKKVGGEVKSFMLMGCQNQSEQELLITAKRIEDLGMKPVALPLTPIPGTTEFNESFRRFRENWTLEQLHPLLYPLASEKMSVKFLEEMFIKYSNHQNLGDLTYHPSNAPYQRYGVNGKTFVNNSNWEWEEEYV